MQQAQTKRRVDPMLSARSKFKKRGSRRVITRTQQIWADFAAAEAVWASLGAEGRTECPSQPTHSVPIGLYIGMQESIIVGQWLRLWRVV